MDGDLPQAAASNYESGHDFNLEAENLLKPDPLEAVTMSREVSETSIQTESNLHETERPTDDLEDAEVRCCAEDIVVETLAKVLSELPSNVFESTVKSSTIKFAPF
ncbi:unnamed protein product [Dibothriocephalus latus]|uniref:Uncharacterized protein n=1 Tax=Dibothriocephalus latus TaxID=60516 RepID=A0A3P7NL94_DIBLA|nr:unnamed protein product [Dibothriocephalus latus]